MLTRISAASLRRSPIPNRKMPLLFSYGTLQDARVQQATFGRRRRGDADRLVGYEQSLITIEDPSVVETSGKTQHPIVRYTGDDANRVAGTVFEITDGELADADRYEADAYKCVSRVLASGKEAWVCVDVRFAPVM